MEQDLRPWNQELAQENTDAVSLEVGVRAGKSGGESECSGASGLVAEVGAGAAGDGASVGAPSEVGAGL